MIEFTAAVWSDWIAEPTEAGRAAILAGKFPSGAAIELFGAGATLIRTITTGPWTAGILNGKAAAIPGDFTDTGVGEGTPELAVFKAGATEIFRCDSGVGTGFYALVAAIQANVPIRRGMFGVTIPAVPEPGTVAPAVVTAPSLSGTPQVGAVLTVTPGTYSGNPAPTVIRQILRNGVAIATITGTTYTCVEADLSASIRARELASNQADTVEALSNAIGPIAAQALTISGVPSSIPLYQNTSHDLTQYVSGGIEPLTYSWEVALPDGVTLDPAGQLIVAPDATVQVVAGHQFRVTDSAVAPSADLPVLGLTSAVGGADLPFAFAQTFKRGAVPGGSSVVASGLTGFQAVPIATYTDGSLRSAWVSGRGSFTAGVRKDVQFSAGPAATGTHLSLTDLRALALAGSFQIGGYETISLADLIGQTPADVLGNNTNCVFTGPECSYWVFTKQVAGHAHLQLRVPILLHRNGKVQIRTPVLQNGYFLVPSPENVVDLNVVITLNGTERFNQTFTVYHHWAPPLVLGSDSSYWYDPAHDPQITPKHDTAYLAAAKAIPAYHANVPDEATLNALDSLWASYAPGWRGDVPAAMGEAGFQQHIGILPGWQAKYVTSDADPRAYRSVIAHGLSSGSWAVHYRDGGGYGQNTDLPIVQSAYPTTSLPGNPTTPDIPDGSGAPDSADLAHQPSLCYLPWLLTGDIFYLEEMAHWATWNYLKTLWTTRGQALGLFWSYPNIQERGAGWALRSLAQTVAACPDTYALRSEWIAQWQNNMADLRAKFVDGTDGTGRYQNTLGFVWRATGSSVYTTTSDRGTNPTGHYAAPWMNNTFTFATKVGKDLDLPISAQGKADTQAVLTWTLRFPAQMTGQLGSPWPWTRFGMYALPIANSYTGWVDWYADFTEVYAEFRQSFGLAVETPAPGSAINDDKPSKGVAEASDFGINSGLCFQVAALAIGVEEGAEGCAAGWALVTGASNWDPAASFQNNPVWGIVPRAA